ncbi:unnamed protein product [Zymoseptoria tritici ST99CH_1A5]|uniref:Large ribosomal subunit protein mL67 n=1 Tax=Zymoseptoria tritici ST99CH_1A5 TaxID=1276529 RepID=A0A1Y6LEK4_ZYMTR|nr:unnamed protein product [Zymoseptoria tritici ST99CH_1A5]
MQRAAAAAPPTGQHLYAYCHVKTNQVLYSLSRNLNNSHLKQLPDVGANYTPPKLRKDHWRPLFAVSLPPTEDGRLQKVDMMRRLREYRMLHELYWEPSDEMSRPMSQKKIDAMQRILEDRGGSKKETVYDVVAREKKKMRVKMVMDQKANSIADLAATLLKQDEEGARLKEELDARLAAERERELSEIIKLAQSSDAVLQRHLMKEKMLREKIASLPAGEAKPLKITLKQKNIDLARWHWARKQVRIAREARAAQARVDSEAQAVEAGEGAEAGAEGEGVENAIEDWSEEDIAYLRENLEPFPEDLKKHVSSNQRTPAKTYFTADGVTVRWANTGDAEFAAQWPTGVALEPLGITRYSHPKLPDSPDEPEFEPIKEVAEFKALQWTKRKENWELPPGIADRVMARRAEMGLEEHPDLANKFQFAEFQPEAETAEMSPFETEGAELEESAGVEESIELDSAAKTEEGVEVEEDVEPEEYDVLVKPTMTLQERRAAIARMHKRALEVAKEQAEARLRKRQLDKRERRKEANAKQGLSRKIDPSTIPDVSSSGAGAEVGGS